MAKIKLSSLVSDARGLVGGVIFSRNAGGSYVKTFKAPINPGTSLQARIRGIFGTVATAWRAKDYSKKTKWRSAVYYRNNSLGEPVPVSGSALFQSVQTTLLNADLQMIDLPPVAPLAMPESWVDQKDQAAATTDGTNLTAANLVINTVATAFDPDIYFHFKATGLVSAGVESFRTPSFTFLSVVKADTLTPAGGQVSVDLTAALNAGIGPSIYNIDSRLAIEASIMSSKEGWLTDLGRVWIDIPAFVPGP